MQISQQTQLKKIFFLYTLNQFFALEREQRGGMLRCFDSFRQFKDPNERNDVLKKFFK